MILGEHWDGYSLFAALIAVAKRKLDDAAQFRVGPSRWPDQPMQKRKDALGRRWPRPVVFQVVRSPQPAEETALGLPNDRLFRLRKQPPFVQAVALESPA